MWGQGPPAYSSWDPCTAPDRQGPPPMAGRTNTPGRTEPAAPGALWISGVENEGSAAGNAPGTVPGQGRPPGPSHLSAPWLSSRLAPERLSLPDLLPESEARLRSLPCEDSRELCPLSASSQPPPASPGWWLTAGTALLSWAPQTPRGGRGPPQSAPAGPTSGSARRGRSRGRHGRAAGGGGSSDGLVGVLGEVPTEPPGPLWCREHGLGHGLGCSLEAAQQSLSCGSCERLGCWENPGSPTPILSPRLGKRGEGTWRGQRTRHKETPWPCPSSQQERTQ